MGYITPQDVRRMGYITPQDVRRSGAMKPGEVTQRLTAGNAWWTAPQTWVRDDVQLRAAAAAGNVYTPDAHAT
jgi:hypothetical protein